MRRMKLKIKETCLDKHTGEVYRKSTIIDVGEKRAKEILACGVAEKVTTPRKKKVSESAE